MPPQLLPNFCGSFYQTRWPIASCDQAINVYPETKQLPGSAKAVWLYGTPGLRNLLTPQQAFGVGPCRGWFSQDGKTWVVVGTKLYMTVGDPTDTTTYIAISGVIQNDGFPVSFATNGLAGDQLGIVGGGQLLVYNIVNGGPLHPVTLPFSQPVMMVFQDGYGLINQGNSPTFWFSALEDFTSWDALDFVTRSGTSDNCVALAVTRDRLFFLGSKTSTLYYDSGDALNPWVPYPGTTTQIGCVAAATVNVYNDTVRWLAQSPNGQPRVVESKADLSPKTISTPPIDAICAACSTLWHAEAMTYEQNGHTFYLLSLPDSPLEIQTYGFDATESDLRQAPIWHARAGIATDVVSLNSYVGTGAYTQWRGRGVTAVNNVVLMGDYAQGFLYQLDPETYTDNGVPIRRERIVPYLSNSNQWLFGNGAELGIQAGQGIQSGQGSDPQVEFQVSRDGSLTWITRGFAALGAMGQYLARAFWTRFGRARGDRLVFRVIQTDPSPCVWTGLWVDLEPGSGQLV